MNAAAMPDDAQYHSGGQSGARSRPSDADPKVIVLGEDVADEQGGGIVGCTKGLSSKYGKSRVRSTPISEQAIIGAAIGAAIVGMRPVAEIMLMNFTTVAMDMIVNHAAKLRFMSGGQTHVPITIRTMTGAGLRHRWPARRLSGGVVRAHGRDQGRGAVHSGRCVWAAAVLHLR